MTREQFIQLYDSHSDSVAEFLSYYVKERNELEDLLQDVFLRVWKYRVKVSLDHSFLSSYLLKIARNVALTYIAKKKKSLLSQCEELDKEPIGEEMYHEYQLEALHHQYSKALEEVPTKARVVYLMSREDGLTYKEIAQNLEISPKTVEVHISKALKVLRHEFSQYKI